MEKKNKKRPAAVPTCNVGTVTQGALTGFGSQQLYSDMLTSYSTAEHITRAPAWIHAFF